MLLLTRARFWRLLRLRCVAGEVADSFRDVPIDGFRDLRIDRFREGFRIETRIDGRRANHRETRIDGISKSFASPLTCDTRKYARVIFVIG